MNEFIFSELAEGTKAAFTRKITLEMEDSFREISGDENPLHQDDDFACEVGNGRYHSHVTFGMLTASFYSTLAGMYLPGNAQTQILGEKGGTDVPVCNIGRSL